MLRYVLCLVDSFCREFQCGLQKLGNPVRSSPVLLEPFVKLHITIPSDLIGDVSSDISGKRGRILGTDILPGDQSLLEAEAPLSEVMSYSNQLKSITGGTGTYEMEYSHDERTPSNVQAEVIKAFKPVDQE